MKDQTAKAHDEHVVQQFGARAAAYVTSAVHAQGEDLQALATFAKDGAFARALDMGCGGGHASFTIAPHVGAVIAYDLSDDMLNAVAGEAAKRGLANLQTKQGNVENLPFADASFDLVVTRYSAHHWHNWPAALREARRVLNPGGAAMFMDIIAPPSVLCDTHMQAIELLRDTSHVRDYSAAEWTQALRDAGFAPGEPVLRRVRLEFASWIARMQTPPVYADAIRQLQKDASADVRAHFAIEDDGSFTLDQMSIAATAA